MACIPNGAEMDPILDGVGRIVGQLLGLPGGMAAPDDDLVAAGLGSLAMVEVLMAVEGQFGVRFPAEALQAETFASVRRIAETVVELSSAP